jgi:hypothetical protein
MSISAVSGSSPQTPPAKAGDELRESITAKAKEAEALVLQARIISVRALDIAA